MENCDHVDQSCYAQKRLMHAKKHVIMLWTNIREKGFCMATPEQSNFLLSLNDFSRIYDEICISFSTRDNAVISIKFFGNLT